MEKRILQIVPSTGFRAVYSNELGGIEPAFDVPVACFALVEEANENRLDTRVIPMIITDCSDDAEADNFLGVVGPGLPKEAVGSIVVDYGRDGDKIYKIVRRKEEINNAQSK